MRLQFLSCFVIGFICLFSASVDAQNVFKITKPSSIGFLEYLPSGYNNNSDKYPVVFFLHGLGERGAASTDYNTLERSISVIQRNGPPKYTKNGQDFPFILISPQLKSNYGNWPAWYIMEVIDYCKTYLRIDEKRIYLTGLSLGGGGVWTAAQDFPQLFAAIIPVCGSNNSPSKADQLVKEDLPVWAFHGDKDETVPMARTVNMVNALNACVPSPKPTAKITIYHGVGHNAWEYAFRPDHSMHNPNVYEWLLSFTNTINDGNKIPVADAGEDKQIQGTSVEISGSGSDADGSIESYSWEKISGPDVALNNTGGAKLSASGLKSGAYVFRLRVTDNKGNSDSDYVTVTVQSGKDPGPVVSAGADKTITLPVNAATIDGTASVPKGKIESYVWTKVSGGSASLANTTSAKLNVSDLVAGSYVFRLTVKDDSGLSKSDDMTLNVKSTPVSAPVVSAGPDRVVSLPIRYITLFGSLSDKNKIRSVSWSKVSGGDCVFSDPNTLRPTITHFTAGTYVFRVTLTDEQGVSQSDDVTVKFDHPPVVDAGGDKSITLSSSSESLHLTGKASDPDGSVQRYTWSKYSGPDLMLTNKDTSKVTLSRLSKGTYVLRFSVWDNAGLQSSDFVTVHVQ